MHTAVRKGWRVQGFEQDQIPLELLNPRTLEPFRTSEVTMSYDGYATLTVAVDRGVAWVTIDHPPINLLDLAMIRDLDRVGGELEADDMVRVAVFRSAN